MAYKYFTKRLLQEGNIDLASVFPEKQAMAREQCNVSYGLPETIDYLRTATDGFKFSDQRYIDLDNAVRAIIGRYYISKNIRNPFEESGEAVIEDEYVQGNEPKKAAIVADGKTKQKDVPEQKFKLPVSDIEEEQIAVADAVPPAPVDDKIEAPEQVPGKETPAPEPSKVEILDAIEVLRFLADDGDESAKEAIETLQLLLED